MYGSNIAKWLSFTQTGQLSIWQYAVSKLCIKQTSVQWYIALFTIATESCLSGTACTHVTTYETDATKKLLELSLVHREQG